MRASGTHQQPAGTFSDDSSLAFCLAEVMCSAEWTTAGLAERFLQWYRTGYWSAHGTVFDIGIATREALSRIEVVSRLKRPAAGMNTATATDP